MRFNILGPLEVLDGDRLCTPSAAKVRCTLALLLVRANQVIDQAAIIDELWGDNPPSSAVTTAQTYIYQLRKKYEHCGDGLVIQTRAPGYLLRMEDEQLDARMFERFANEGKACMAAGEPKTAAHWLRQAQALWRGPALADLPVGQVLQAHVAHLEEMRLQALYLRIVVDAELGGYRALIPELRSLVTANPLDEWLHEQLITGLNEAGRRSEALQVYRNLQRTLDEELGIEPSAALRQLQHEILVGSARRSYLGGELDRIPTARTPAACLSHSE